MDLALNNLQWLICHKTKLNQTKLTDFTSSGSSEPESYANEEVLHISQSSRSGISPSDGLSIISSSLSGGSYLTVVDVVEVSNSTVRLGRIRVDLVVMAMKVYSRLIKFQDL